MRRVFYGGYRERRHQGGTDSLITSPSRSLLSSCSALGFIHRFLSITLVGDVNLAEHGLKMRHTKVSGNSQLYSKNQAIYILRLF